MIGKCVELTTAGLSLNQLEAVAHGLPLLLTEAVERNIESSHDRLSRYLQENRRIFGVTTGYGPLADTLVGSDYSGALQRNLIAHLSAGVGAPLSRLETRATMAARISALALVNGTSAMTGIAGLNGTGAERALRCAPQLLGAVSDQIDWHNQIVHIELNSVTDNPILPDDLDGVLHGGNFFGQHVAFASDALANAVITLAVHA